MNYKLELRNLVAPIYICKFIPNDILQDTSMVWEKVITGYTNNGEGDPIIDYNLIRRSSSIGCLAEKFPAPFLEEIIIILKPRQILNFYKTTNKDLKLEISLENQTTYLNNNNLSELVLLMYLKTINVNCNLIKKENGDE